MKLEQLATKHPYYCATTNYFSNDATYTYPSVEDFMDEMGNSDLDYNLCFRFDVYKYNEEDYDNPGDCPNGYHAEIFMMQQRKGKFCVMLIEHVSEESAPILAEWLKKRYDYLKSCWAPFE